MWKSHIWPPEQVRVTPSVNVYSRCFLFLVKDMTCTGQNVNLKTDDLWTASRFYKHFVIP